MDSVVGKYSSDFYSPGAHSYSGMTINLWSCVWELNQYYFMSTRTSSVWRVSVFYHKLNANPSLLVSYNSEFHTSLQAAVYLCFYKIYNLNRNKQFPLPPCLGSSPSRWLLHLPPPRSCQPSSLCSKVWNSDWNLILSSPSHLWSCVINQTSAALSHVCKTERCRWVINVCYLKIWFRSDQIQYIVFSAGWPHSVPLIPSCQGRCVSLNWLHFTAQLHHFNYPHSRRSERRVRGNKEKNVERILKKNCKRGGVGLWVNGRRLQRRERANLSLFVFTSGSVSEPPLL